VCELKKADEAKAPIQTFTQNQTINRYRQAGYKHTLTYTL